MDAIYISDNSFSVDEDKTSEFVVNRRLKLDCGVDGFKYASVFSSVFSTITTVTIDESVLTSNLIDVLYSVVKPSDEGNLPNHYHSTVEGDGGSLSFVGLSDTPDTYIGTLGKHAQSTGSGVVWVSPTFLELTDTPSTYSGSAYLRSTSSGIVYDGLILKAPNASEWALRVTNSGTLYTTLI